jgi:hypothetical protein
MGPLQPLLLNTQNRILGRLGDPELHTRFGWNFDDLSLVLAKLHHHVPRFALGQDELTDAGNYKLILRLLVRQIGLRFEKLIDLLFADPNFLGKSGSNFGFGQGHGTISF